MNPERLNGAPRQESPARNTADPIIRSYQYSIRTGKLKVAVERTIPLADACAAMPGRPA